MKRLLPGLILIVILWIPATTKAQCAGGVCSRPVASAAARVVAGTVDRALEPARRLAARRRARGLPVLTFLQKARPVRRIFRGYHG